MKLLFLLEQMLVRTQLLLINEYDYFFKSLFTFLHVQDRMQNIDNDSCCLFKVRLNMTGTSE
jgi:hypothetical protein